MLRIKQFLVGIYSVVKKKQLLEVICTLVEIKQFFGGYLYRG